MNSNTQVSNKVTSKVPNKVPNTITSNPVINILLFHTKIYKQIGKEIIQNINGFLGFVDASSWRYHLSIKKCTYCGCPQGKEFCKTKDYDCKATYIKEEKEAVNDSHYNLRVLQNIAKSKGITIPIIDINSNVFKKESCRCISEVDSRMVSYLSVSYIAEVFKSFNSTTMQLVLYLLNVMNYDKECFFQVFDDLISKLRKSKILRSYCIKGSLMLYLGNYRDFSSVFFPKYVEPHVMSLLMEKLSWETVNVLPGYQIKVLDDDEDTLLREDSFNEDDYEVL